MGLECFVSFYRLLLMFYAWKVARTNVNTFRFRKHSTFKSHAYENETNAQNDKFEFPWWSSAWIFIGCLDFLENFHYWSLEYIIFPSIEGLSNWEILRSIKLTVEVFQLSHLRILFPTPLSVCLSSRQGLNPDELQKVLDWLFSLLFKESRQNHRSWVL